MNNMEKKKIDTCKKKKEKEKKHCCKTKTLTSRNYSYDYSVGSIESWYLERNLFDLVTREKVALMSSIYF